jgi:G3E family GTPase
MKRRDKFDHLVIETTGLADPAPVIQTFFVDDEVQTQTHLDVVVTVVDAKHIWQHWGADEAIVAAWEVPQPATRICCPLWSFSIGNIR